jgi:hypothetical protein
MFEFEFNGVFKDCDPELTKKIIEFMESLILEQDYKSYIEYCAVILTHINHWNIWLVRGWGYLKWFQDRWDYESNYEEVKPSKNTLRLLVLAFKCFKTAIEMSAEAQKYKSWLGCVFKELERLNALTICVIDDADFLLEKYANHYFKIEENGQVEYLSPLDPTIKSKLQKHFPSYKESMSVYDYLMGDWVRKKIVETSPLIGLC